MTRQWAARTGRAAISFLLLLWTAGAASANPIPSVPFLQNETHTWITFESQSEPTVMFMFHSDEYELTPELDFPEVSVEAGDTGFFVDVHIPNFVDPLDTKKVLVTFLGGNPEPSVLPEVLSIVAWDTPFPQGGDPTEVYGEFHKSKSFATDGGFEHSEWWVIHPNPDHEIVRLFIPRVFEIFSVHIDTYSIDMNQVPEPGALLLVSAGLLGLTLAGRRRVA